MAVKQSLERGIEDILMNKISYVFPLFGIHLERRSVQNSEILSIILKYLEYLVSDIFLVF